MQRTDLCIPLRICINLPITVASCEIGFIKLLLIRIYLIEILGQTNLDRLQLSSTEHNITLKMKFLACINISIIKVIGDSVVHLLSIKSVDLSVSTRLFKSKWQMLYVGECYKANGVCSKRTSLNVRII